MIGITVLIGYVML